MPHPLAKPNSNAARTRTGRTSHATRTPLWGALHKRPVLLWGALHTRRVLQLGALHRLRVPDGATFTRDARFDGAEFRASAAFSGIQGQPSFGFEECKFNEKFRDDYEWGPIPIPEDNDGRPAGAVWEDFQEEGRQGRRHDEPVVRGIPCRLSVRKGTYVNVYGSHMGFIWESYANRPIGQSACLILEADAAYAQAGGAGVRPGGVFRKRRFPERILKRGDGLRHSGGKRPITRPAINVLKPNAIDGYKRS